MKMRLHEAIALNAGFGQTGWKYGGRMPVGYIPPRQLAGFPRTPNPSRMPGPGVSRQPNPSLRRVRHMENKGAPGGPGAKEAGIQTPKDKAGNFEHLKRGAQAPEGKHDNFEKHQKKATSGKPVIPHPNAILKKLGKAEPFGKSRQLKADEAAKPKGWGSKPHHPGTAGAEGVNRKMRQPMGLDAKVKASEAGEPPAGAYSHAHIDPQTWFRPPSLTKREKDSSARIPSDDVRETNDRFLDVTKRNSRDTREQRMKILRRSAPGGNPPQIPVRTTAVAPHQGVYTPMAMLGSARKTRLIMRPARMENTRSGMMRVAYGRQGCI